jgi:hypothetical protein
LCRNALNLGLSLCLQPQRFQQEWYIAKRDRAEARWATKLVRTHLKQVGAGVTQPLPRIDHVVKISFVPKLAEQIIGELPLDVLTSNPQMRVQLLRLADDLVGWTIAEHAQHVASDDHHLRSQSHIYEWNNFFFSWLRRLAKFLTLDEERQHILDPIKESWTQLPILTGDLMQQFIFAEFGEHCLPDERARASWRAICDWVLDDLGHNTRDSSSYAEDQAGAVSLIIFVSQHNLFFVEDDWEYIDAFTDTIDRWVETVGRDPDAYNYLLQMLSRAGRKFIPEPALKWLNRSLAAEDARDFFGRHDNGPRTAILLQRMWRDAGERIRDNATSLRRYSELVDRLVLLGIPLAGYLQQSLERRN